jgi:glucosylceramidase
LLFDPKTGIGLSLLRQPMGASDFEQERLKSVALRNPDGSIVLLVLNSGGAATTFSVAWKKKYATYRLDANAVATFRWLPRSTLP